MKSVCKLQKHNMVDNLVELCKALIFPYLSYLVKTNFGTNDYNQCPVKNLILCYLIL